MNHKGRARTAVPAAVDALGGVLEVQLQALLGEAGMAAHDDRPLPAPAAAAARARRRQARDVEALRSAAQSAGTRVLLLRTRSHDAVHAC